MVIKKKLLLLVDNYLFKKDVYNPDEDEENTIPSSENSVEQAEIESSTDEFKPVDEEEIPDFLKDEKVEVIA